MYRLSHDYFADFPEIIAERRLRRRLVDEPLLQYIDHLEERIAELENEIECWKEGP